MEVALLTVGDELLAGEIQNTNATWLSREIVARGSRVVRSLSVPDDEAVIARYVHAWAPGTPAPDEESFDGPFDAVVLTGGLGGTHDDVTTEGVAAALGREVTVDEATRDRIERRMRAYRERNPDSGVDLDPAAWSRVPAGAAVVANDEGLAPGYRVDGVYVTPGIPAEMKAVFARVADAFAGDRVTATVWSHTVEGALGDLPERAEARFGVAVGSYANSEGRPNRLVVTGTDPGAVERAADWLRERVDEAPPPEERTDS